MSSVVGNNCSHGHEGDVRGRLTMIRGYQMPVGFTDPRVGIDKVSFKNTNNNNKTDGCTSAANFDWLPNATCLFWTCNLHILHQRRDTFWTTTHNNVKNLHMPNQKKKNLYSLYIEIQKVKNSC